MKNEALNKTLARRLSCIATIGALVLGSLYLTGCSTGQPVENTNGSEQESAAVEEPTKDEIKADQIEWNVGTSAYDGNRRVTFDYSNNSTKTVANVKLNFSIPDNVTDEEISAAYGTMYGWNEDSLQVLRNNGIWSESTGIVNPGEPGMQSRLMLGYTYLTDMSQYELTTPDMMQITYIDNDKLYTETYDYLSNTYSLSNKVEDYVEWPDSPLAQAIPQIEGKYIENVLAKDNVLSFDVKGVSTTEFNAYTEECASYGFVDSSPSEYIYMCDSADGKYKMNLMYDPDNESLSISINLNS